MYDRNGMEPSGSRWMPFDAQARLREAGQRLEAVLHSELAGWVIILGGVVLRLRQMALHLSLGNDEAALLRSIVHASYAGLTQPFPNHQSAPVLFLYIEKIIIDLFGNRDVIAEIFPLLCGMASLYLFHRIAKRHFGSAGLLALLAFALSVWLVIYSADAKQYSSDVMVTLLLVDQADRCLGERARGRDFVLLAAVGVVGIWLSHPAMFVLPGIGLAVLLVKLHAKDRRAATWTLAMGSAWVVAFGIDYLVSLRGMGNDPYLLKYWQGAFMPMPPWRHPAWFLDAYKALLLPSASRTSLWILLIWTALLLVGSLSLVAGRRALAVILLLPFALTLAASALQKYPMRDRLLLFLVPLVYLVVMEGLRRIYAWTTRWNRAGALLACAVLFALLLEPGVVSAKRNFVAPPHFWDMRPVVEYMAAHWNEGDTVYVSGGGETFQYYAESYGLQPAALRVNNGHRIVRYFNYVQDLHAYVGKDRVWIVFANFDTHTKLNNKQSARYEKYLNRVGLIQDRYRVGLARAYLCKFDP